MELVSRPLTIIVNDSSHSLGMESTRSLKNSTSKMTCHACGTLFHNSSGLLGGPCQLECKVLFIFTHTCSIGFKSGEFGGCSYKTTFELGGHCVLDGYPAGTQVFLQDNTFVQKGPIHSLISLDWQPCKFPVDAARPLIEIIP